MGAFRDRIRELRRVRARDLKPNPRNWRTHPVIQREALETVLREIGFADASLARQLPDGSLELIDGHLRRDIAPDQEVPVLVLDVTEEEAAKVLLTLDPLAGMATADKDKLESLIEEVGAEDGPLRKMLDGVRADFGLEKAAAPELVDVEPHIDRAEELQAEWKTERGQMWEIPSKSVPGQCHRVMCGDSTKAEDVGKLLAGRKAFIMVTDPPYGVEYDADWRNQALRSDGTPIAGRAIGKVVNDDQVDWAPAYRLSGCDVGYFWHADRRASEVQASIEAAGYKIRCQIIWVKSNFAIGRGDYHWGHEPCWYAVKDGRTSKWCGDRTQSTTWNIAKPSKSETGHST